MFFKDRSGCCVENRLKGNKSGLGGTDECPPQSSREERCCPLDHGAVETGPDFRCICRRD